MDTDKFNIFFAGLVVGTAEQFCEIGIAHITVFC